MADSSEARENDDGDSEVGHYEQEFEESSMMAIEGGYKRHEWEGSGCCGVERATARGVCRVCPSRLVVGAQSPHSLRRGYVAPCRWLVAAAFNKLAATQFLTRRGTMRVTITMITTRIWHW